MNPKLYKVTIQNVLAGFCSLTCLLVLIAALAALSTDARAGEPQSFVTLSPRMATLPWKVRSLEDMVSLWRTSVQDRTHRETLLVWINQRGGKLAETNHFDALLELPTDGNRKEVRITTTLATGTSEEKWNRWKPNDGEARLIEAAIKRAKMICRCENVVFVEIEVGIFHGMAASAQGGEPAIFFNVLFDEGGVRYACELRIYFSMDAKDGRRLPGLKFRGARDTDIDGNVFVDKSGIIDGYEGLFHYGGGTGSAIKSEK